MTLTVIQFETVLIKRTGKLLTALSMDGSTIDGNNPDLVDPMGYSIRQAGGSVTTITDVVDADLSGFAESDYDELLDVAELRTLQNIYGNFALVDVEIGPRNEAWSSLGTTLEKLIARKEKRVKDIYGIGIAAMETGNIILDFAEHDEDNVDSEGW